MSIDAKMAWRNIWRNPRRTGLTISAIAFASLLLIFMLSFQFGSYEALINSSVKIHAGHLKIQAKEYQNKRDMHLIVPDPSAAGKILDNLHAIDAYTFRANAFSLISSKERTYGVIVTGIDPVREAKVSSLAKLIRVGSYLSEKDTDKALLGELLAKNLKAGPGDELIILGQGRDGSIAATVVQVKGIYRSGIDEFDRSTIHIPLKTFQDAYSMRNSVHEVVAVCKSLRDVSTAKKNIRKVINNQTNQYDITVLDWQELMPGLFQGIQMDLISGIIFYVILILVVAFSILNTFLMAIFERTREFGVLMAIGTTPGRLTKIVLFESMSMTMLGIIAGIIIGSIITFYFQVNGIDIYGSSEILSQFGISGRIHPRLSILSVFSGPLSVFLITFLSALYPTLKIRKLRPVEAIAYV
ncbi:MAG: FtsX-like permease family protein [Deltaproteobacteria bacterium]|nr:FtsX-like permease family protein [Deltaproteobacteria bacterium]